MSSTIWTARALGSSARRFSGRPWRVVEAQNRVSTLRLVDTLAEQAALENLLETSKPPLPPECIGLHWLLATPFRYPAPPPIGSRFRAIGDPGVWYGATALRTAFAEVGFWRQRFLLDSPQTPDLPPVAHTAFRANIGGNGIVLFEPPFARDSAKWENPNSYAATQALAQTARDCRNRHHSLSFSARSAACARIRRAHAARISQARTNRTTRLVIESHSRQRARAGRHRRRAL